VTTPEREDVQITYRARKKPQARIGEVSLALSNNTSVPREIDREKEVENENLSFATSRLRYNSNTTKNPLSPKISKHGINAKYTKFILNNTSGKSYISNQESSQDRSGKSNNKKYMNFTGPIKLSDLKEDDVAQVDIPGKIVQNYSTN